MMVLKTVDWTNLSASEENTTVAMKTFPIQRYSWYTPVRFQAIT